MEKFFEKLREMIPDKGGVKMVITRNGEEFLVTTELKKDINAGYTSPVVARGHWNSLDENFFKNLVAGVAQVKPFMFDAKAMVDSVKPPEAKKESETKKAPAKKEADLKIKPDEKPAELFAPPVETKIENADPDTGEITEAVVVDEFDEVVQPPVVAGNPANVAKPDRDEELERIKPIVIEQKNYQEAFKQLNDLLVFYPGDELVLQKIEKVRSKLPVAPPPADEF
jgi:hypothetical protein